MRSSPGRRLALTAGTTLLGIPAFSQTPTKDAPKADAKTNITAKADVRPQRRERKGTRWDLMDVGPFFSSGLAGPIFTRDFETSTGAAELDLLVHEEPNATANSTRCRRSDAHRILQSSVAIRPRLLIVRSFAK